MTKWLITNMHNLKFFYFNRNYAIRVSPWRHSMSKFERYSFSRQTRVRRMVSNQWLTDGRVAKCCFCPSFTIFSDIINCGKTWTDLTFCFIAKTKADKTWLRWDFSDESLINWIRLWFLYTILRDQTWSSCVFFIHGIKTEAVEKVKDPDSTICLQNVIWWCFVPWEKKMLFYLISMRSGNVCIQMKAICQCKELYEHETAWEIGLVSYPLFWENINRVFLTKFGTNLTLIFLWNLVFCFLYFSFSKIHNKVEHFSIPFLTSEN